MRVPSHSGGRRGSHSARHPKRPERPPPPGVAPGAPTPSALAVTFEQSSETRGDWVGGGANSEHHWGPRWGQIRVSYPRGAHPGRPVDPVVDLVVEVPRAAARLPGGVGVLCLDGGYRRAAYRERDAGFTTTFGDNFGDNAEITLPGKGAYPVPTQSKDRQGRPTPRRSCWNAFYQCKSAGPRSL
jgi:hypothetical protein